MWLTHLVLPLSNNSHKQNKKNMNVITLMGRLVADPELRTIDTQNGAKSLATFTLAVTRSTNREQTDFIRCVAWDKKGEIITKYAAKGQELCVSGSLSQRKWKTTEGDNRETFEVNVQDLTLISGNRGASPVAAPSGSEEEGGLVSNTLLDELLSAPV